MKWLLENDVFSEDLEPLQKEIIKQGHSFDIVKYIPFDDENMVISCDSIFYGSLNLANKLSKLKIPPVIFCTRENYECTKYYAYFGQYLLNQKYVMLPFCEFKRRQKWLFDTVGGERSLFVRPSSGAKIFTGTLINEENFNKDYERLGCYDVSPHAMVVVGQPHNIIREWRLVIAEDKIISGSMYSDLTMNLDYSGYCKEVKDLANKILKETTYRPDPIWTMDFCETKDGKIHLLEIGGFSCAGLYQCELEPVVRAVSKIAKKYSRF